VSLNHRARLALVSATTTGLVLFALFTSIVFFARRDVLTDKRAELVAVMQSFTPPTDSSFDIDEFHSAHPELSATLFDAKGRRLGSVGRMPPRYRLGFHERDRQLTLGRPYKGQYVAMSMGLRETDRGLRALVMGLVAAWFPLTLIVGIIAWASAHSVFRPLERLSAQALAMGGKNLSERLVTPDSAEFGAFARDLNQMLDRVEETVRREERFSADAAHELRTPLAILRTRLETTLLQPRSQAQYEATLRRSVEEIGRLTAITEALLRSARGEAVPAPGLDLEPLVREAVERWTERFTVRNVRLESETVAVAAPILPDEARVVLDNLLDNALRYAPEETSVRVRLSSVEGTARLTVRDEGPGVPPELGDRIFDRLVRGDDSRNRASGGAGIGLSVCRQIVEERGGRMFVGDGQEGGAEVGCLLPRT